MSDAKRYSWLSDIPVEVEAATAALALRVGEILALREGSVIATNLPAGENINVFAGGALIGAGEFSSSEHGTAIRMVRLASGV